MNDNVTYSLDPIPFRSVGEKKLADAILSREGQWDATQACFLTKERLLQDLTRRFTSLNSLLRHAPTQFYAQEGKDVNATYPKCPRLLMQQHNVNNSQLSLEDPTKQNINYRRQIAQRNAMLRERDMEGRSGVVMDGKERTEWIESLESEFARMSRPGGGVVGSVGMLRDATTKKADLSNTSVNASSSSRAAAGGSATTELPRMTDTRHKHSSLLMQLKKTREQCNRLQGDTSIVKSILSMDASASLKSTVTRMFADPKNADNISKEEFERREREYMEERSRSAAYQNDLMREEKEAIERELALFK